MEIEIRPMALRQELMEAHADIKRQIESTRAEAAALGIEPYQLRDTQGNWAMAPLLVAQVQCLHALVLLNKKGI